MISSPEQLIDFLNKLPSQIRDQEKVYIESKAVLEYSKLRLSIALSEAILKSNGANATEKKAYSVVQTAEDAADVIESQKEADLEQAQLKYLENRFISLRKISSIETELIRTQLTGN